jgi:hypothetical protein
VLVVSKPVRSTMHLHRTDKLSSSSSYAPATLASDLSRIVDPTYYASSTPSASPSSATFSLQPKVYVDHAGDMHDPDYRAFPALPARPKSRRPSSAQQQQPYGPLAWRDDYNPAGSLPTFNLRGSQPNLAALYPRERAGSTASVDGYFSLPTSQIYVAAPASPSHRWSCLSAEPRTDSVSPVSPPATFHSGHGLRYQLNAMSLNVRLKIFRVRRRWRDRHNTQDTQV